MAEKNIQVVEFNCWISNIPAAGNENQIITLDEKAASADWTPCTLLVERRRMAKTEPDEE